MNIESPNSVDRTHGSTGDRPDNHPRHTPDQSQLLTVIQSYLDTNSSVPHRVAFLERFDLTDQFEIGKRQERGGFANVYDGTLQRKSEGHDNVDARPIKVAIKLIRDPTKSDTTILHSVVRELVTWTALRHPNVLPCLGFAELSGSLALLSEWMENGNLVKYLSNNFEADRWKMMKGVVHGLEYLHKDGVVHSDLKGANILVDFEGVPMLSDFGNSRLIKDGVTMTGTKTLKFSLNWAAIEFLTQNSATGSASSNQLHTKETDIWALGMVFYEILTLKVPFHGFDDIGIVVKITNGEVPKKPTSEECPTDNLERIWKLCTRCWFKNPANRPTIEDLSDEFVPGNRVKLSLVKDFEAHSKLIRCVAFSPVDAQTLATSSYDKTVCIWVFSEDTQTTTKSRELTGHKDDINSIIWSSDGVFLFSGCSDKNIRKWNTSSGKCELIIPTPHSVYALACSPNDKFIVSGSGRKPAKVMSEWFTTGRDPYANSLFVWDAPTGNRVFGPLTGHTFGVTTVAYSRDGQSFISGSFDRSIIIWDSTTGEKLFGPFNAHSDWIRSISCHPSGGTFVTGSSDASITLWDGETAKPLHKGLRAHRAPVISVQFSPDGRFVLSASEDGSLKVWDAKKGKVVRECVKQGGRTWTVAFSPDGRWVASGDAFGNVQMWEFSS